MEPPPRKRIREEGERADAMRGKKTEQSCGVTQKTAVERNKEQSKKKKKRSEPTGPIPTDEKEAAKKKRMKNGVDGQNSSKGKLGLGGVDLGAAQDPVRR